MVELAMHEDKRLPVKEIARRQDLSVRYLEQVIASLKKAKLVNGTKGPTGGYTLNLAPDKVTLAEIIFAVEGRNPFAELTASDDLSETVNQIFKHVDDVIDQYMVQVTLDQIVSKFKAKASNYMYYI